MICCSAEGSLDFSGGVRCKNAEAHLAVGTVHMLLSGLGGATGDGCYINADAHLGSGNLSHAVGQFGKGNRQWVLCHCRCTPGSGNLSHAVGQFGKGYRGCGIQLTGLLGGHLTSNVNANIVCDAAVHILAHLHNITEQPPPPPHKQASQ